MGLLVESGERIILFVLRQEKCHNTLKGTCMMLEKVGGQSAS